MAFTSLKLTTFGRTLEAKCKQGKGLHLSRVAIGDGLLGNGSMTNRTALVSEKLSMLIDAIQLTDAATVSAVIATLDNGNISAGFNFRELAIMGTDPDTSQEGVYLYDNAGEECEYLDTQANGVIIYERLKLLINTEATDNITFEASGNPLYLGVDDPVSGNTVTFTQAETRVDLQSGETLAVLLGKIKKWLASLGSAAFTEISAYAAATHASRHKTGGADALAPADIGAAAAIHNHTKSQITDFPTSMTPTAHAATHATAGTDPIPPGDIGAATKPSTVTATFAVAGWVKNSSTNCYEQTVAVAGLLATDGKNVRVEPVGSTDAAAQALTDAAYAVLAGPGGYVACNTNGYLYARCPAGAAAPTVAFQVAVVISR